MTKHHFAALLGDSGQAGVYHLPQRSIAELRQVAKDKELALFHIDLAGVRTKEGFLAVLAQALNFPDWFGHNWDALDDCLTDMSWQPADGYVVILNRADEFRTADEEGFVLALGIFQSAAEFWRKERVPFWTLVELQPDGIAFLPDLP